MTPPVRVSPATTADDYRDARALFQQYAAGLGVDLCFQGFAAELDSLPEMYGGPRGVIYLAQGGLSPVGCVGVRPFDAATAEMKRLFVAPAHRGSGLGRRLAEASVAFARAVGYRRMVLDTLVTMTGALAIYSALGFREIPPYYGNPHPSVVYLGLDL